MKSCSVYRESARETLDGRWNETALMAVVIFVLMLLFNVAPSVIVTVIEATSWGMTVDSIGLVITLLVVGPLEFAMYSTLLAMKRGTLEETPVSSMLKIFTGDWQRFVITMVLQTVIISIASFFTLGILGIILALAYGMTPFLLRDYPDLTPREALRMSREMMRGYKWDLFLLELSFIGWILVSILTLGIGLLWVMPYMNVAEAYFYDDLKEEVIVEE